MRRRFRLRLWHRILFLALWTLLVLYPNPLRLAVSVYRVFDPPVDAAGVEGLLSDAPREPQALERWVLDAYPYQYDWHTYNVPWYFPTLPEALERGTGDCKTRFVVLASLFEARDIPYTQTYSLSHFWVIYEGKEETPLETASNAWMVRDEEGTRLQVPREEGSQIFRVFRRAFWESMPTLRKALLLLGLPLTAFLGVPVDLVARRRRMRAAEIRSYPLVPPAS